MKRVSHDSDPIREKFTTARYELAAALIERNDEIDLILTALIAIELVLLVGPPARLIGNQLEYSFCKPREGT